MLKNVFFVCLFYFLIPSLKAQMVFKGGQGDGYATAEIIIRTLESSEKTKESYSIHTFKDSWVVSSPYEDLIDVEILTLNGLKVGFTENIAPSKTLDIPNNTVPIGIYILKIKTKSQTLRYKVQKL